VAIDIEFTAAKMKHAHDCNCAKITTAQMPNITWLARKQLKILCCSTSQPVGRGLLVVRDICSGGPRNISKCYNIPKITEVFLENYLIFY